MLSGGRSADPRHRPRFVVLGLRAHGHREVIPLPGADKLASVVRSVAKPDDFVVLLGAGNITQWAYALPGELKALGVIVWPSPTSAPI